MSTIKPWRRSSVDVDVKPGERILAWAAAGSGTVAATREALYIPQGGRHLRIPWDCVEDAGWDLDESVLRVTEVGEWGRSRPQHRLDLAEPGQLLELVRERVTASVLLQRHVPIMGRLGVRVIARRSAEGQRDISWLFEYDEGIDPMDPFVDQAAQEALAAARDEVGL